MITHSKSTLTKQDRQALDQTFYSGYLTAGPLNDQFKKDLSNYLELPYIKLFSSGSSALLHIIKGMELSFGDEILVPDYICENVLNAVIISGCKPVLYDNNRSEWISGHEVIAKKITSQTKAIIVNHTFGIAVNDIPKIARLGVPIIEDCCHALTPKIGKTKISRYSLASFYSFNATKLIAVGEGGAVACNDKSFYKAIESVSTDQGLSDLSCSLGISQLKQLPEFLEKRSEIASFYDHELKDLISKKKKDSVYFRYPLQVTDQSVFLKNKKVAFKKGVDDLLHKKLGLKNSDYPNTSDVFKRTVSIPIYPSLKKSELKVIVEETKKCIHQ